MLLAGVAVPAATVALSRRSNLREAPARGRLVDELVEVVHGAPELAVAGREAEAAARVGVADAALLGHQARDARAQGAAAALGGVVQGLTLVAVLAIGADAVSDGRLDGILLAGVVLVAFAAFEATMPLSDSARRLSACVGAARRVEEVVSATPAVVDPPGPLELPPAGALTAEHLTVTPPGASQPVLHDISLALAPGSRIALVGASGAGKTTLARALVRFVDPAAGTVALGGVDVRDARQTDLRRAIRLVSQEAHLFTTSLRQNVTIGCADASDEQVLAALHRAGLRAWVATLPLGLDTVLGEEGSAVSGGQRRRIALARGLVADAVHLVLDEPTAHLDADSAAELLRGLAADVDDPRGILVISHSYRGLEGFDEIVVLAGGRVAERGTHAELITAGGAYAALHAES
jgi:thiol reductant ABC exporter CydC subunit